MTDTNETKRKVYLNNLPRIRKNQYDWKNGCGNTFAFEYDGIIGEITILKYIKPKLLVMYEGNEYWINSTNFKNCEFGNIVANNKYKYPVGLKVKGCTIIGHTRVKYGTNSYRAYRIMCDTCGYVFDKTEYSLSKTLDISSLESMCGVCQNKIVIRGVNDISTTDKWMMKYLVNENDAYTHTSGSCCMVETKCPICGRKRNGTMSIYKLKKRGNDGCTCSSHGYYPEELVSRVLDSIGIEYTRQLTKKKFEWVGKYKYDFYFEKDGDTFIIETNGAQHYLDNIFKNVTLKSVQENDMKKRENAIKNGITHYINLDCKLSSVDYIKQAFANSELPHLLCFDVNDINWNECHNNVFYDVTQNIREYIESGKYTSINECAKNFHKDVRHITPIIHYLFNEVSYSEV